jgi:hypothetical protein
MLEAVEGPYVVTGNLNPAQITATDMGPSTTFMGDSVLDPRFVGTIGAAVTTGQNKIYGHTNYSWVCVTDQVPSTLLVTNLVNAQASPVVPAAGTLAMTMTGTNIQSGAGTVAVNIPLVPFGQADVAANVVNVYALDFGYTTATTVAGSATVTIPAGAKRFFQVGQKVVISGAGSATTPQIMTVKTLPTTPLGTSMIMEENAIAAVTTGRVGNAIPGLGLATWPWRAQGVMAMADPHQGVSRCLQVTSSGAGGTGYTVLVRGYDVYGVPMAERIAVANSATATAGVKAFKYVTSCTLEKSGGGTFGANISVGTTDVFGFALKSDLFEYTNIAMAGSYVSASTGYTAAVETSPATATTGDVRGTYAVQTASNGTRRLIMFVTISQTNLYNATNLDSSSMFGVPQFTA